MAKKRKKRRVAAMISLGPLAKHHVDIYAGCESYAKEANWECVMIPYLDRVSPGSARGVSSYDGVIGRIPPLVSMEARRAGVPVVNVWVNSPAKDLPNVFADYETAGVMAAGHLLGQGFRNFGFIGIADDASSRFQLKGFRSAIKDAGMTCSVHKHSYRFDMIGSWDTFIDSQEAWIDTWKTPIGLCGVKDEICRYMINLCHLRGLNVPGDVAVISIENGRAICVNQSPTLTSVEMGYDRVGYQAAELLDRLMDGEQPPDQPILIKPHSLIPRQSTDSFAVDDPLVAQALRFMSEHCQDPIKVTDVVASLPSSLRVAQRAFQKTMGRSIADEILRLRIERAKRSLVETDEPLKQIAYDSGFVSRRNFDRAFVRLTGITPKEYRSKANK
ncbi:MAG: substrate-binding domain-containing protein [bacterium]|nr:substrate-binding domain-containing protein [bacterium]